MLVTDVDGTLVDEKQEIPERNLAAIKRFQDAGGLVTLGTGRVEASAGPYVERLGANAPAILYNGGRIVDFRTGRVLLEGTVSDRVCASLFDLLETDFTNGIHPILYCGGRALVRELDEVIRTYSQKDRIICEPVGDLRNIGQRPITKFLLIGAGADLERLDRSLKSKVPDGRVSTVRSEPEYLEVLPYGASKGSALQALAKALGIGLKQVVAVGDSLNDLEMVRLAGLGVAVANAHPLLKQAADFVSPYTNEQAAVADLIERFCLT